MSNKVVIARELGVGDASAFRALRLHALKTEGEKLGPRYEDEVRMSKEEWEARVTPTPDMRYFGLFDAQKLVGAMRAAPWDGDQSGQTALWGGAYVLPPYRGQRLAKPLYEAREVWTRTRYKAAVLFIKADNDRSADIHKKHGAEYLKSEDMAWPGRPAEKWDWYRIPLAPKAA